MSAQLEKYKRHILRIETKNKLPYIGSKTKTNEKVEKKVAFANADPKSIIKTQSQKTEDKSRQKTQEIAVKKNEVPIETLFEKHKPSKSNKISEILPPKLECNFESVTESKVSIKTEEVDGDLALVQISENPSQFSMEQTEFTSYTTSKTAIRTQSAPEIIQSCSTLHSLQ